MTTKTKADANGATATLEGMAAAGNEAFKESFEKFSSSFTEVSAFGKETLDAYVASANAATKSIEHINNEALGYGKQAMEDGVSAAKAAMTSRSVQEMIEINTDYTKSAFDAYMGQMNKMNDMMVAAAKDTTAPLNDRFNAWVEMVQAYRP